MKRKLIKDGNVYNLQANKEFKDVLDDLKKEEEPYAIGISFASFSSPDKIVVSVFTDDGNGEMVYKGTRDFV